MPETLKQRLRTDLQAAMRARDAARLSALRMWQAALRKKEIDERIDADDDGALDVAYRLVRQYRDSIEQFKQAGRTDLVEKETAELEALQSYLPAQLSEQEVDDAVREAIRETGASTLRDMRKVMGLLRERLQKRADMGKIGTKVKERLQGAGTD